MKQCNHCRQWLTLDNFHKNKTKSDGLQYICKNCARIYRKKYYKNNREQFLKRSFKYWMERKKILRRLKYNGCAICGYNKCYRALTFHHVNPHTKKFQICAWGLQNYNNSEIQDEVHKCILLCFNCHMEIEGEK